MSASNSKRVVVVGSSFAGMTAALELRKRLDARHEVVVLDPRADFTFIPSLIWLPFGMREPEDVTFPLAPMYAKQGIRFVNEAAGELRPRRAARSTTSSGKELAYDRLMLATGPRLAFEKVPGLGPDGGYTQSVCNLDHALLTARCVGALPREPRAGRRRHRAGRLVLRRVLRVPPQHAAPDQEGRPRRTSRP